jgi:uncharacterized metal-binding protein YceD (DUF177 family)
VSKRDLYAVRISGLAEGDHDFSFELDQKFFASFEQSEIENGDISADVTLEKKPGIMTLHFRLKGEVEVVCDHCLEPFMTGIESTQQIFVKVGDTPGEPEDDVVMIGRDDYEIGIGQYLYEFIVLALPLRKIHPDDKNGNSGCDPEMLQKLDAHRTGKEQNDQSDPRWDALKGIIEKNN